MEEIKKILNSEDYAKIKALFAFSVADSNESILFKFNLWGRWCFHNYYTSQDAPFHHEIDSNNLAVYKGELVSFVDIAFRGAAKTARTKLFFAFVICNDIGHFRKYFRILAEDGANSRQISTDVYNMLVSPKVKLLYPEVFEKTAAKKEETQGSFSTTTGVKLVSGIVGSDQRGALQEASRPDMIWFEDFENRKTLRSRVKTIAIWDNMEEARTGLSANGGCIYTCNYVSEQGNVHKLVIKKMDRRKVLIVPIQDKQGSPAWNRYSKADIARMKEEDDDFEGERMCEPSASKDIYFDRAMLDLMPELEPMRTSADFRMYKKFDPSHRYAGGHDIAGGVGLDSSASVFIDFDTIPAQVVGTYAYNLIKPEAFGHEIAREADLFGGCLVAPERNYGTEAILVLKQLEARLFLPLEKDTGVGHKAASDYGWHTNALTKPKMLSGLSKAVEDGLLMLNDPALIAECKSYTRNDLIENVKDPRLTTRHFDLLMAAAIAWQMKDYAVVVKGEEKAYSGAVDAYINRLKHGGNQSLTQHLDQFFPDE